MTIHIEKWQGCYDLSWQDNIVPEAFSHPAKFSHGLILRIYEHAKKMGWVKPGDYVLDPFAGVGLGAVNAMGEGLNWIGIELEEKFVKLGEQNIELWQHKLKGWPNLGTARIVQGDSRNLRNVIKQADIVISSPPFTPAQSGGGINKKGYTSRPDLGPDWVGDRTYSDRNVGHTPGNLANLKEGNFDMICGSPPFTEQNKFQIYNETKGFHSYDENESKNRMKRDYCNGQSPGQLGAMKKGSIDAVINKSNRLEEISLICSSPLYEDSLNTESNPEKTLERLRKGVLSGEIIGRESVRVAKLNQMNPNTQLQRGMKYSPSKNNLGNSSGDTFWSASREIVQQCFDLLKDGGESVPDGEGIDFCEGHNE
jgi:hypothetical protein